MKQAETKTQKIAEEEIVLNMSTIAISLSIIVSGIIIAIAVFFGLTTGFSHSNINTKPTTVDKTQEAQTEEEKPLITTVSVDNDASMGSKNAKVVIVEFSDYECPFCKRHFSQTVPQIKKNYIDTGKVRWVYRDLIAVPAHNPTAMTEALYAECAKKIGGNKKYFAMHDKILSLTNSNGQGTGKKPKELASAIGIDASKFLSCVNKKEFEDEIKKDFQDADKAGIRGTPGFVIGTIDKDGKVTGEVIAGAYPYSKFAEIIEKYLKNK